MIGRCHNPNWKNQNTTVYYRDKGIIVCNDWRRDFTNFESWALEAGYADDLSIDRIDSNGNYCPENCRWITIQENRKRALQKRGFKKNPNIHHKGKFMVVELEGTFGETTFVKVVKTGLAKSESFRMADELKNSNPYRYIDYFSRVTDGYAVGDIVLWNKLRRCAKKQ